MFAAFLLLCPDADLPHAHEALRFPGTAQYATESWRFGCEHVAWLERQGLAGAA